MALQRQKRMTVEEFYRLPNDDHRQELVRGYLVSEPTPGAQHGYLATAMVFALESYARQHGDSVILTCDTGFVLARNPDTVRAPDVSLVSRQRYEALKDKRGPIPGAPDLAVEVLSPSDRKAKVKAKVAHYLQAGAKLVWIVDPASQQVRSYQGQGAPIVFDINSELTAPALLPGFRVAVAELFRDS